MPEKTTKRMLAKAKRDKGQLAIENSKMTEVQWCQEHDPLFQIKGKERHLRKLHQ